MLKRTLLDLPKYHNHPCISCISCMCIHCSYFFTILANVAVFGTMLLLLTQFGLDGSVSQADEWVFSVCTLLAFALHIAIMIIAKQGMALGIICVGAVFSFLFHLGTQEPSRVERSLESIKNKKGTRSAKHVVRWYKWFLNPSFYMV